MVGWKIPNFNRIHTSTHSWWIFQPDVSFRGGGGGGICLLGKKSPGLVSKLPKQSMGLVYLPLFTYICHKHQPNVGKYTSPMDDMICNIVSLATPLSHLSVSWGFVSHQGILECNPRI